MPFWNRKQQEVVQVEPEPPEEPVEVATGITMLGGEVTFSFDSHDQMKLAIKQLKLLKKELGVQKKELTTQMTEIRAGRRAQVAQQGSMLRGGGGFGKAVRAGQRAGRDADRRQHVGALAPYEDAKMEIDRRVVIIDRIINQVELMLLDT